MRGEAPALARAEQQADPAGGFGAVVVSRAAQAERAGSAVAAAIEVGLRSVDDAVITLRRLTNIAGADAAEAIEQGCAMRTVLAARAAAATIDVRFVSVQDLVGATRWLAQGSVAVAAHAIRVSLADREVGAASADSAPAIRLDLAPVQEAVSALRRAARAVLANARRACFRLVASAHVAAAARAAAVYACFFAVSDAVVAFCRRAAILAAAAAAAVAVVVAQAADGTALAFRAAAVRVRFFAVENEVATGGRRAATVRAALSAPAVFGPVAEQIARAAGAGPSAVHVRLPAVLSTVRARRRGARSVRTDSALAIRGARAALHHRASGARRAPAIDPRFRSVPHEIRAGGLAAHPVTDAALAVARKLAGLARRARPAARPAAVEPRFRAIDDSVHANAVRHSQESVFHLFAFRADLFRADLLCDAVAFGLARVAALFVERADLLTRAVAIRQATALAVELTDADPASAADAARLLRAVGARGARRVTAFASADQLRGAVTIVAAAGARRSRAGNRGIVRTTAVRHRDDGAESEQEAPGAQTAQRNPAPRPGQEKHGLQKYLISGCGVRCATHLPGGALDRTVGRIASRAVLDLLLGVL